MPRTAPQAPRLDLTTNFHGHKVADPYRWLEDPATAEADPESVEKWQQWRAAWDTAQGEILNQSRQQWGQIEHFGERLTALLQGGFTGMPTWRKDRQFFSKREPGQQFPVLYTVDPDGQTRVLIDPMVLDSSGQTTLDSFSPSWDGNKMAYLLSEGGDEESVLRVMDVASGDIIEGPIDRTRFSSVAWLPNGEAFYYVRRLSPDLVPDGEEQFHRRVYLHRVGADPETDVEIFGAGRKMTEYFSASVSRDGKWLTVDASEGTAPRNDVFLARLGDDTNLPVLTPVVEGLDAMTALSVRRDGRMFVWTDHNAPRGKILLGSPERPTPENWRELVAQDADSVLESFGLLDGPEGADQYIIVGRTRHSIGEMSLLDSDSGRLVRRLEAPGLGTIAGPIGRPEGSSEAWYLYTDNVTPPHVYKYDVLTDTTELWASPPGSVKVPTVHSEQLRYTSADGTEVRMYIMAPDSDTSVPRPTMLYG
jgi:prolyl oligopeptidase